MKEFGKKCFSLAVVCLWGFGTIGGVGFGIYCDALPCAIGCAINGVLAWPTVKKHLDYLKS